MIKYLCSDETSLEYLNDCGVTYSAIKEEFAVSGGETLVTYGIYAYIISNGEKKILKYRGGLFYDAQKALDFAHRLNTYHLDLIHLDNLIEDEVMNA